MELTRQFITASVVLLFLTSCVVPTQQGVYQENRAAERAHNLSINAFEVWDTGSERGYLQFTKQFISKEGYYCRTYKRFYRTKFKDTLDNITYCLSKESNWFIYEKTPAETTYWFQN